MSTNGSAATALATVKAAPSMTPGTVSVLSPDGFKAAMQLAETLCQSGFLPLAIQKPSQALAVILAGQELGLPPMKSLREIHIIEGKPTLSAELMLSQFKRRGGRAKWISATATNATLWLRHPNGDEHTEVWTIERARTAGVTGKDNWKKYPDAMLRARAISAGLRAIGEADGLYDPDEMGAVTTPEGAVEYTPPVAAAPTPAAKAVTATDENGNVLATGEPYNPETGEVIEMITPAQMKALGACLGELGVTTREGRLDWVQTIIKRKVTTSKELTKAEASKAIEVAKADIDKLSREPGADDDGGASDAD